MSNDDDTDLKLGGFKVNLNGRIRITVQACLVLILAIITSPGGAFAQEELQQEDYQLIQTFAPVLYFHPEELFRPQSVDVLVTTARLRQQRRFWFDVNVLPHVSISALSDKSDDTYFLDAWYGYEGVSDNKNYSFHREYYQAVLSPEAGGPPIVAYAHIVRDEDPRHITIQYWLFYYFNDWFNKHEGDWEMIQVVLSAEAEPEWVVLSQHHGGTRRRWSAAQIEEDTHPVAYVALGSHANYFWGNETYPNGQDIGNARVEIMDRTGTFGRIIPEVILIPDRVDVNENPSVWQGIEWLLFQGHWGETAQQSDFGGPFGPADKGDQWERPYAWGMDQPLDTDIWYRNRLRVEVTGDAAGSAQVILKAANGDPLPSAEMLGNVALLHSDPTSDVVADIKVEAGLPYGIVATWPNVETSQVTCWEFSDIPINDSGQAALILQADGLPGLVIPGLSLPLHPSQEKIETVSWDAPDIIWLVGFLPASDVVRGVVISLLAALLPALACVAALYWADRYEKEPKRLLATAFLWGAVPALLVAVVVRLFFRLPVDLLGAEAIDAVRAGLVAPLIEETLKGIIVIFIAVRYRREFDNVLDGIIYGAMVGFGFAMTGNMLSYIGAFLLRGFSGLGNTILIEGVLYGLNHAFYSAIFGAGLGYARLMQRRWERWGIPLATFVLAVTSHAIHNLAMRSAVGLTPFTVAVTWIGLLLIIVVMVWSTMLERQALQTELKHLIPDTLYSTVLKPRARLRAQWRAFISEGYNSWRRTRRLHQLCGELAFKRMQTRLVPDEPEMAAEAEDLLAEIRKLMESL